MLPHFKENDSEKSVCLEESMAEVTGKIEFKFQMYSTLRAVRTHTAQFKAVNQQFSRLKKIEFANFSAFFFSICKRWHHGDTKLAKSVGTKAHLNF